MPLEEGPFQRSQLRKGEGTREGEGTGRETALSLPGSGCPFLCTFLPHAPSISSEEIPEPGILLMQGPFLCTSVPSPLGLSGRPPCCLASLVALGKLTQANTAFLTLFPPTWLGNSWEASLVAETPTD